MGETQSWAGGDCSFQFFVRGDLDTRVSTLASARGVGERSHPPDVRVCKHSLPQGLVEKPQRIGGQLISPLSAEGRGSHPAFVRPRSDPGTRPPAAVPGYARGAAARARLEGGGGKCSLLSQCARFANHSSSCSPPSPRGTRDGARAGWLLFETRRQIAGAPGAVRRDSRQRRFPCSGHRKERERDGERMPARMRSI